MSAVFKGIALVAGIAAMIPGPHSQIAGAVAAMATVGAQLTQKKPPVLGSPTNIQIGANQRMPYAMGRTYSGGAQAHDVGYGPTTNDVPNPYRSFVNIWSVGTVHSIEAFQADFTTIAFDGGGEATGYYDKFMWLKTQRGLCPEPAALSGPHGAIPGWSASHKLSGLCAGLITIKHDKKGKIFAGSVPQFGAILKGVLVYDPRKDSTYPGGSGAHRWADETTWEYSECPSLHALAYARGRYQNGKKVFGCGFSQSGVDVASFVEFANICDANGWKVGGLIYEPGSRWDNLKRILLVAAAQPVFVGGKLRVRFNAPKVALDTITADDLADGEYVVPAMKTWRERKNGLVPKYRSEEHKWELVQSAMVTDGGYVAEDGEDKDEEFALELCQQKNQAAQVTAYELVNRREFGPIVLPCKPRMMEYVIGEALNVDVPDLGLVDQLCVIVGRSIDPRTAIVELVLESETTAKHDFALGKTGSAPATPSLVSGADVDAVADAVAGQLGKEDFVHFDGAMIKESLTGTDATLVNFKTGLGTAAAISGQGAFATVNSAGYGSPLLTGFGALAERGDVYFGSSFIKEASGGDNATLANFKTPLGTAAAISGQGAFATLNSASFGSTLLTGFGTLASRNNVRIGTELMRADGATATSDAAVITALGISSGFTGQGGLATQNAVAFNTQVTGLPVSIMPANMAGGQYIDLNLARYSDGNSGEVLKPAEAAANKTETRVSAGFTGQGPFATATSAAYGSSLLTGFGTLAPRNNVRIGGELVRADGTTATSDAGVITSLGTASAIAGQGAFATVSSAAYGSSLLTGFGVIAARNNVRIGAELVRADGVTGTSDAGVITSLGTASAISGQGAFATLSSAGYGSTLLTGFGPLAARSNARIGFELVRADGTTATSDAGVVTSLGTASAIFGQGALATLAAADFATQVTGASKPENNSTRNVAERAINRNTAFVDGLLGWRNPYSAGLLATAISSASLRGGYVATLTSGAGLASEQIPCTPGEIIWVTYRFWTSANRTGGASPDWYVGLRFAPRFGQTETQTIDQFSGTVLSVASGVQQGQVAVTVPAGAYAFDSRVAFDFGQNGAGGQGSVDYIEFFRDQPGANVTGENISAGFSGQGALATLSRLTNPQAQLNAQIQIGPSNTTNIAPSYTVGASNVTVNIPAHVRKVAGASGPVSLSYGAGAGTVAFNAVWFCYVDDPGLSGVASPTYAFTSDASQLLYAGRYHVASGTAPSSSGAGGDTGGGGGSTGGGWDPNKQVP